MSVIRVIREEQGTTLLVSLIFIVTLGMIIISLTTMVAADARIQALNSEERRAFYAAQSGMEYAIRGINEYAVSHSSITTLDGYSETIDCGNSTSCQVDIAFIGSDSLIITSTGQSVHHAKRLERRLRFIDVASYAVYSSGNIQNIRTIPSGLTLDNATHMPFFDLDELRDMASPSQYFSGDVTLSSVFSFSSGINFVEGNLTFGLFNWINVGTFISGGNVRINTSILPLGTTVGNIYQFTDGATFQCQWQLLWRELNGGLIVNGSVNGTSVPGLPFRFTVRQNRSRMTSLLQYTVNGGPVIFTQSTWDNQ